MYNLWLQTRCEHDHETFRIDFQLQPLLGIIYHYCYTYTAIFANLSSQVCDSVVIIHFLRVSGVSSIVLNGSLASAAQWPRESQ